MCNGFQKAVAAARLGDDVYMVGRIGDDDFGNQIFTNLEDNQPSLAAATAWFAPFPPGVVKNDSPKTVSPLLGTLFVDCKTR
jgi:hypothetical protein